MMYELREMYEDLILDHNRSPRNYPKKPVGATHSAHGFNPYCNDEFKVHLKIEDGGDLYQKHKKADKMPASERKALTKELMLKMKQAAKELNFEEAARLRDEIAKIKQL